MIRYRALFFLKRMVPAVHKIFSHSFPAVSISFWNFTHSPIYNSSFIACLSQYFINISVEKKRENNTKQINCWGHNMITFVLLHKVCCVIILIYANIIWRTPSFGNRYLVLSQYSESSNFTFLGTLIFHVELLFFAERLRFWPRAREKWWIKILIKITALS